MKKYTKKVFIKTLGCQMNVRDSEVIAGLLTANGYQLTADPIEADVILLNTCAVRQHAEEKVWSEIGRLAKRRRKIASSLEGAPRNDGNNKPLIGVVGCMAQNYKEKIFERSADVDFVVGPSDIGKIPGIIESLTGKKGQTTESGKSSIFERKIWETDGEARPEQIYHTGFFQDKEHAYVVISEGCSNFCSYCVVPYVRGPIRHRSQGDILREIKGAIDQGISKFTLLGQNVNAYEYEGIDFAGLLKLVNGLEGLKEFSFITSHPKDTSVDLFRAMAEACKLKKYLHLPVQSGSDRILKAMNRGYSREHYLQLVDKYRKLLKPALLSTDIIVGFPSEEEGDFQDTYDLLKDVGFDSAYIFKYSVRPGTAAAAMQDDVPQAEKERRHGIILQLQKEISKKVKSKKEEGKSTS